MWHLDTNFAEIGRRLPNVCYQENANIRFVDKISPFEAILVMLMEIATGVKLMVKLMETNRLTCRSQSRITNRLTKSRFRGPSH